MSVFHLVDIQHFALNRSLTLVRKMLSLACPFLLFIVRASRRDSGNSFPATFFQHFRLLSVHYRARACPRRAPPLRVFSLAGCFFSQRSQANSFIFLETLPRPISSLLLPLSRSLITCSHRAKSKSCTLPKALTRQMVKMTIWRLLSNSQSSCFCRLANCWLFTNKDHQVYYSQHCLLRGT